MREVSSRRSIREMADNLSDTKSWADLAIELNKYVARTQSEKDLDHETIELADLLKSVDESGNQPK